LARGFRGPPISFCGIIFCAADLSNLGLASEDGDSFEDFPPRDFQICALSLIAATLVRLFFLELHVHVSFAVFKDLDTIPSPLFLFSLSQSPPLVAASSPKGQLFTTRDLCTLSLASKGPLSASSSSPHSLFPWAPPLSR